MLSSIITKGRTTIGIVAQVEYDGDDADKYKTKIKVRIPEFHGPRKEDRNNLPSNFQDKLAYYTKDEDLPWIPVCLPLGFRIDDKTMSEFFEVDEMVYVTYTDDSYQTPIVIGTTGRGVDGVTLGNPGEWTSTVGLSVTPSAGKPLTFEGCTTGEIYKPISSGYTLTSPYGERTHPVTGKPMTFHTGIDLGAANGTSIRASYDGIVISTTGTKYANYTGPGYGNNVVIQHTAGNDTWYTRYGHMLRVNVRGNQKVSRGEVIGQVGSTGTSTGPHLHFEILNGGIVSSSCSLNPVIYLPDL